MREVRKDRLTIHAEKNRRCIADENERRIIVKCNGLYRLRLGGVGDDPFQRNVVGWREKRPDKLIHLYRSRSVLRRKISLQDFHFRNENHMSVCVDLGNAFKRCGTDDLFAACGSELKRLPPDKVGKVVPVIDLRLVHDERSAGFHDLARPARILGPKKRGRRECQNDDKDVWARALCNA